MSAPKTDSIDKIALLMRTAGGLESFDCNFKKATAPDHVDKYNAGFNHDERFAVFSARVFFSAYTGHYGSSSCSTYKNCISEKIAAEYFVKALNRDDITQAIFQAMAEGMREEAKRVADAAEAEIERLAGLIDRAKKGHGNQEDAA